MKHNINPNKIVSTLFYFAIIGTILAILSLVIIWCYWRNGNFDKDTVGIVITAAGTLAMAIATSFGLAVAAVALYYTAWSQSDEKQTVDKVWAGRNDLYNILIYSDYVSIELSKAQLKWEESAKNAAEYAPKDESGDGIVAIDDVDFEESNTIMEANASHFIMKLIRGLEKCRKNAPFMLWFKMYSEKKNIHEVYNKKKNECIDNGIKTTAFEDIIKINMEVGWSLKKLENGYASIETVLPFNFKNISTSLLEIIQNIKYDDIKHSDI